jgi:hypothetical protein
MDRTPSSKFVLTAHFNEMPTNYSGQINKWKDHSVTLSSLNMTLKEIVA